MYTRLAFTGADEGSSQFLWVFCIQKTLMESVSWYKITAGLWMMFSTAGDDAFTSAGNSLNIRGDPFQEWLSASCHKSEGLEYEVSIYNSSFHTFKFIAALDTCKELLFGFTFLPPCAWGRQSLWEVQKKHRAACGAWRFATLSAPVSALLAVVLWERCAWWGRQPRPTTWALLRELCPKPATAWGFANSSKTAFLFHALAK